MAVTEFTLPIKIDSELSINSIYAGIHWSKRRKQADGIAEIVYYSLLEQHIPLKIYNNPVNITFYWHSKLDLDNHGYLAKLIIDGLKGYLIKDDTKKYIQAISHHYWDKNGVKVIITDIRG